MAKIQTAIKTKIPVGKKIAFSKPLIKTTPKTKIKSIPRKTLHSRYT